MITQNELKKILHYNPDTGIWTWLIRRRGTKGIGSVAGYINSQGYLILCIGGKKYGSSRLAFFYMTGRWPKNEIDHINRKRDDDRWCNLREATSSENKVNTGIRKDNSSGYKGVYQRTWKSYNTIAKKWVVQIAVDGKNKHVGIFDNMEEAIQARKKAALKYFNMEFYSIE